MTIAEMSPTITPDELLRMPDSSTKELVDGQIVEKQVSIESSKIELLIAARFQVFLFTHPVAEVYPASLGYQCFQGNPTKIRKPDVTVVLLDRLKKLADPNSGFMPIVPDLAVEVVSPNDTMYEVDDKVEEYLSAGFPLVWVADPKAQTITAYSPGARPMIYTADDEIAAEAALPGFRCKVADFFPATAPPGK